MAEKANKTQENWTEPTLLNGWVLSNSAFYTPSYMIDNFGFVHLRGQLKDGTIGQPAFVLAAGYRPSKAIYMAAIMSDAMGNLVIGTDGSVTPYGASNAWLSLDGIVFSV